MLCVARSANVSLSSERRVYLVIVKKPLWANSSQELELRESDRDDSNAFNSGHDTSM
jgi:hypothetical protein